MIPTAELDILEVGGQRVLCRPGTSDEIVATDNLQRRSYERHGVTMNGNWLDIGAYIGTFALAVLSSGGEVICYEPFPQSAELARRNLALNGWEAHVVEAAVLGRGAVDEAGAVPLTINDYRGNFAANSVLRQWKRDRPVIMVPVVDFDDVVDDARVHWREGLRVKMDIEGAELKILDNWGPRYPVDQLTFEYHFAVDPSIERARRRFRNLEDAGLQVRLSHKLPDTEEWQGKRSQTLQAWCVRP